MKLFNAVQNVQNWIKCYNIYPSNKHRKTLKKFNVPNGNCIRDNFKIGWDEFIKKAGYSIEYFNPVIFHKCKCCGKTTKNELFCSTTCVAKHNNKTLDRTKSEETKAKISKTFRERYYIKPVITCKVCGNFSNGNKICNNNICRKFKILPRLIDKFNFNVDIIGTSYVFKEFNKIKDFIRDEYLKYNSLPIMAKKYSLYPRALGKIFKTLEIPLHTQSEAGKLAVLNGRAIPSSNRYKKGHHISWENKKFFYRSSYELNYCLILDDNKISYEMEAIRLKYFDTQKQSIRVAVPDFLIGNKIVEIKSEYTLDIQNMKDKMKAYLDKGYDFELICNGKILEL